MIDHVSALCDSFRLLFPTRNIESIVPMQSTELRPRPSGRSRRFISSGQSALDLRILLGGKPSVTSSSCIRLEWVSTDSERRVALIVDAVDEIVNSPHGQLERLPLLPKRLLQLCDGVLHNEDGTYRMSVKLDVQWPMEDVLERRLWLSALVTLTGVEHESRNLPA